MILKALYWILIGFIEGTIIYWFILYPTELRKENYEMLAYLIMRYKGFDFFQRKKETLIDYNERLKTYILCDEFIRSKKCL